MVGSSGAQLSESDHNIAVKAFEELGICTQLAEAAASLGWKGPTSIQQQAIPNVLQGRFFKGFSYLIY